MYFSKFSYTWGKRDGHNKIALGENRKSTFKMVGGGAKIKWRGRYLFLENDSAVKLNKEKQENKLS